MDDGTRWNTCQKPARFAFHMRLLSIKMPRSHNHGSEAGLRANTIILIYNLSDLIDQLAIAFRQDCACDATHDHIAGVVGTQIAA